MFRQMRRFKQLLTDEESIRILKSASSGVLAVLGDEGYPYALPMSYAYSGNRLYFHCAKTGHKLDAIAGCPKVSFCVIETDRIVQEEYTTYFRSVIAFGRARILDDEQERRHALELIAEKYSPDFPEGRAREVDMQLKNVAIIEIEIEHLTGKEATELVKAREKK